MSTYLTVIGAYGRDYTSKKEVMADWDAGKDFQIDDMSSRWDGSMINKEQQTADMVINVRYKNKRQVCPIRKK